MHILTDTHCIFSSFIHSADPVARLDACPFGVQKSQIRSSGPANHFFVEIGLRLFSPYADLSRTVIKYWGKNVHLWLIEPLNYFETH